MDEWEKEKERIKMSEQSWACCCLSGKTVPVKNMGSIDDVQKFINSMKFCPYCGKERPEEPKALWEEISIACGPNEYLYKMTSEELMKRVSFSAIEWLQNNLAKFVKYHNNVTRIIREEELYKWLGDEKEKCQ